MQQLVPGLPGGPPASAPPSGLPGAAQGFVKVSGTSDPRKVAGKLAHTCRDNPAPAMLTIGSNCINQAVKAICIARGGWPCFLCCSAGNWNYISTSMFASTVMANAPRPVQHTASADNSRGCCTRCTAAAANTAAHPVHSKVFSKVTVSIRALGSSSLSCTCVSATAVG
jgi:stage V sporulation protein SpoVS